MAHVYRLIGLCCFVLFTQWTANSTATELRNSKIFGIANHPSSQMCQVREISPLPIKLTKTIPSRTSNQYGFGKSFDKETLATYQHFLSLAEGCRSSSADFRDESCSGVIVSINKILNEDAYGFKAFEKPGWLGGYALSTRIAFPMFLALETATLNEGSKVEALNLRAKLLNWFKKRSEKAIGFYQSKSDESWNNQDTSWEMLMALAGIESDLQASISRINGSLDKVFSTMRKDGSIPAETERGAMALHYSASELSSLLKGMIILQANGKIEDWHTTNFERAVNFYLSAITDFDLIDPYAAKNVSPGRDNPRELELFALHGGIGMAHLFADKFDRPKLKERLENLIIDERMCSYENLGRQPIEALASCPSPKVRVKVDYPLMVTLGRNSCLYNSFLTPSALEAEPEELETKAVMNWYKSINGDQKRCVNKKHSIDLIGMFSTIEKLPTKSMEKKRLEGYQSCKNS